MIMNNWNLEWIYLIEKDITFFDVSSDWQLIKWRIIKAWSNCFLSSELYDRSWSFNQLNSFETDIVIALIKASSNFIKKL